MICGEIAVVRPRISWVMDSRLHALEYTRITDSFGVGEHGGQVYSSGLLAHLTKNFAPHPENAATEALGHILAHSAC